MSDEIRTFSIESLRGDDPRLHGIMARARAFIADVRDTLDDEPLTEAQAEVVERIAQDHIGGALTADPEPSAAPPPPTRAGAETRED